MHLNDFEYSLPEELIAQQPTPERDGSRLLYLDRAKQTMQSGRFTDILDYFHAGDLLVLNDTRVIPARLFGSKVTGGKVEVLLVRRCALADAEEWLCLTRSSKQLKPGTVVQFNDDLSAEVLDEADPPYRRVSFRCDGDFLTLVDRIGHLPLPPYIKREDIAADRSRYQTVYARESGAVAAPTAGLHFTPDVLQRLQKKGVVIAPVTLHVGLGTFLPVRVDDISQHRMHSERFSISPGTAAAVNLARSEKRRIIALGTTSTRVLETATDDDGYLHAGEGESDIFIYPGYRFKTVDALITNFHLPKSTLLMLVSAFAGRDFVLSAYRRAVEEQFRFFSYGDCMLIV